ncbi:hypothetical protein SAMN05444004_1184 [Jannaschia faecimaris]|uniref:Uncharacterized protein n=1 Tax=Jannaschia faecimaris TaxID=1244108 RepID=A0A1H3TLK5_9RHOB|nr:hypothetical protein SAMN05444004_1184 [Jannaschia faecimaris]
MRCARAVTFSVLTFPAFLLSFFLQMFLRAMHNVETAGHSLLRVAKGLQEGSTVSRKKAMRGD